MVSFEQFNDMHDLRLKPRILRNLLLEHVPTEKQLLTNSHSLSKVVSEITIHELLSESSTDPKLLAKWKSVVDDWVDRLLALVSSDKPDICSVGIALLGVTCEKCSSNRFITSYSVWFNSLLTQIKKPGCSSIVRVVSCGSVSLLLTRLSRFPHVKKDAVSHAAKVIQPIIKLLEEESSEKLWESAVHLLSTVVIYFPAAFHSNYDKVEATIASKIFLVEISPDMLKKFAHFLALLPNAKGDESSWSLMMQKLLISINVHLSYVFQGLEEETKGTKAIQRLVPPGKDSPPPLGGQNRVLDDGAKCNSEQFIVSKVSALMLCISTMLTSLDKSKVPIPLSSLVSLVERVLAVNGSLPRAMSPFMTGIQQELVCAELPTLHSSALDLLHATIKSIRRQLSPRSGSVVKLISNYFRRCALPELKIKLYLITKTALLSIGAGMAMRLAQEVVTNASVDLDPISVEGCDDISSKNPLLTNGSFLQACGKKRKHSTNLGVNGQPENSGLEVRVPNNHLSSPISVKIAALEALKTLLTIGSVSGSDTWRERVDSLLMTTATNACNGRWANAEDLPACDVELQLAALRAFLASLVAPSRGRPAFLAEGLKLFQSGQLKGEMKVSEFCADALMSLEVVIHPRALPLDGLSSLSNGVHESNSFASQKHYTSNLNQLNGIVQNNDELCKRWLESADADVVPFNTEVQRTADVMLPKKLKLGDNAARNVSLNAQEHIDIVASEDVEQVDADMVSVVDNVLEFGEECREHGLDKDGMVSVDVSRHSKEEDVMEMEKARSKILGESDDDSVPSLGEEDYLSSDSESDS